MIVKILVHQKFCKRIVQILGGKMIQATGRTSRKTCRKGFLNFITIRSSYFISISERKTRVYSKYISGLSSLFSHVSDMQSIFGGNQRLKTSASRSLKRAFADLTST